MLELSPLGLEQVGPSSIPVMPAAPCSIFRPAVTPDTSCNLRTSWVSLNEEASSIAAGLPSGQAALQGSTSNSVTSLFQTAQGAGFTAVRLFLHGESTTFQLQTSPGILSLVRHPL